MDALKCAKEICVELRNSGHIAYFAGGWVRDHLLGIDSSDIDIATDALPEEIIQIFPDHVLVGAQFGVVLVLYGPHQFELATFRRDVSYENGRTPSEIELRSTPLEDAKRRDFTINGLFFDPQTNEIYDFVNGRADLAKGVLRTIGNPFDRFQEDRLRLLRAIRFAYRFGFVIDPETLTAISSLSVSLLPAVSMERIWQEFSKMREGPNFQAALLTMHETKLLQIIFPPLANVPLHMLEERLAGMDTLSSRVPAILFLAALFAEQDAPFVQNLHQHLRASNEEGKWLESFLEIKKSLKMDAEPFLIAKLFSNHRFEICFELFLMKKSMEEKKEWLLWYQKKREELEFFVHRIRKKEPLVKAQDLIVLGVTPSKEMGRLLQLAERIAINENIRDTQQLLQRLHDYKS